MQTTSVNPTAAGLEAPRASQWSLGPDEFMPLLIAELQHQNPLESLDAGEMFSQFTSLMNMQQLTLLHDSIKENANGQRASQALAMIGRRVEADSNGARIAGTVSGVVYEGTQPLLVVGSARVPVEQVVAVKS